MPMQTLTPTLSRFAVEGAIETERFFRVVSPASKAGNSADTLTLVSPLYREAGEGGGEGPSAAAESTS
jgi:hypothetical protein